MQPDKILDGILKYLCETTQDGTPKYISKYDSVATQNISFSRYYNGVVDEEFNKILNKHYEEIIRILIDDKYIISEPNGYRISFRGSFFIENGGYEQLSLNHQDKNIRLGNLEIHQKSHQTYMTVLTVILSAFAFLALFLQSLEKFHVLFRVDIWASFFLFSAGALVCICTLLISKEWLTPKKQ